MQTLSDILGDHGALAAHIENFNPRPAQQQMAQAIEAAIEETSVLVAEAGTGTGKTFAYLVPVILSGEKTIISTGTKHLQDQLYYRDIPQVCDALAAGCHIALLKGRKNYLCLHRHKLVQQDRAFSDAQLTQLNNVNHWLEYTRSGDLSELENFPEDSPLWSWITSTTDNCLNSDCPDYAQCYVIKARKAAQQADIVVVNHHLFFADMALKGEGFGEILPGATVFVFDEAHQLSDVATQFFGVSITSRQLSELVRDIGNEIKRDAPHAQHILSHFQALNESVNKFSVALGADNQKAPWENVKGNVDVLLGDIAKQLQEIHTQLKPHIDAGTGIEQCWRRALQLKAIIDEFASTQVGDGGHEQDASAINEVIRWYETHQYGFKLHQSPVSVAQTFSEYIASQEAAWIFTSATLAMGGNFNYFTSALGLDEAQTRQWQSPFDFRSQAILYLPTDMPEPNDPSFSETVLNKAVPVINACGGKTFLLVTSKRALHYMHDKLRDTLKFPLLVQGEQPRTELLNRFRSLGNAVLLGTRSFWEGVDVKGDALTCVIIDKLPFATPDEPLLQARLNFLRDKGLNPFMHCQMPEAVIGLKQGIGRLIRDANDYGVLMICDPRVLTKSYGKIFLRSLPAMRRARHLEDVKQFLECHTMVIA